MTDIEDTAITVVAGAVAATPQRMAMAAAITRWGGNLYARLVSHAAAEELHTKLARQHRDRNARGRP